MSEEKKSTFDVLNAINVNGHTEQKNGLTYLSWAWAWAEVKKQFPGAEYEVVKQPNGLPYVYDDQTGYMVFTRVTIGEISHEMWLPVMDSANKAMKADPYSYMVKDPAFQYCHMDEDGKYRDKYGKEHKKYIEKIVEPANMFDVNKTIMRCLVKNLAMFGLGLYIYAGEDLPEDLKAEELKEPETISEKEFATLKTLWAKTGRDFEKDFPGPVTKKIYAQAMEYLRGNK